MIFFSNRLSLVLDNSTNFLSLLAIAVVALILSCRDNGNPIDGENPPCILCPIDFGLRDFEPAWSPDGRMIAYIHGDTSVTKHGLYFINADGSNKRLVYASGGIGFPDWSPDGQWFVFHDRAQIYKMKVNGDSLTQLTFEGRNFFPAWSPDGGIIAYQRSYAYPETPNVQGIWTLRADGSGRQQIFSGNSGEPSWHPNGSALIFFRGVINESGNVLGDSLWRFRFDLQRLDAITFFTGDNRYPRYSPDGRKIAFTSQANGGWPQIWVMNSDGTNAQQLTTTQGYGCDWSPDNEWIVYTDSRAVNGRLWIMRKDGSERRQLTFD